MQLTWEWAATRGDVPATASEPRDIDLIEFYEQLTGLARMFHIEISAKLHPEFHADVPSLPPFPGQRVHLANRSEWLAWPEEIVDGEAAEAEVAGTEWDFELLGLPALTSAALAVGEERAGEMARRGCVSVLNRLLLSERSLSRCWSSCARSGRPHEATP